MEALVLDVAGIKADIKETTNRLYPEFEVIIHENDDDQTAMTVCPPARLSSSRSVDIFISGRGVDFYCDVDKVGYLPLTCEVDDVAHTLKNFFDQVEASSRL